MRPYIISATLFDIRCLRSQASRGPWAGADTTPSALAYHPLVHCQTAILAIDGCAALLWPAVRFTAWSQHHLDHRCNIALALAGFLLPLRVAVPSPPQP
jgi:hypothetical protein